MKKSFRVGDEVRIKLEAWYRWQSPPGWWEGRKPEGKVTDAIQQPGGGWYYEIEIVHQQGGNPIRTWVIDGEIEAIQKPVAQMDLWAA